jgi:hypothetical protein
MYLLIENYQVGTHAWGSGSPISSPLRQKTYICGCSVTVYHSSVTVYHSNDWCFCLVCSDIKYLGRSSLVFWGTHHLTLQGQRVSWGRDWHESGSMQNLLLAWSYPSTVNMEAIYFWKALMNLYQNTWHHTAEVSNQFAVVLVYLKGRVGYFGSDCFWNTNRR